MHALGFDILEIADERGEVLASGHFHGRVGDTDSEALAVARRVPGKARLVHEQVMEGGSARNVLALEAVREVQRQYGDRSARVVVVGGRIVGRAFVDTLDPSARLYAADGALVAAGKASPAKRSQKRQIELLGPDDVPLARVEICGPDRQADRCARDHRLGRGRARRRRLRLGVALRRAGRPSHHRSLARARRRRQRRRRRQSGRVGAGAHARRGRRAGRHVQRHDPRSEPARATSWCAPSASPPGARSRSASRTRSRTR